MSKALVLVRPGLKVAKQYITSLTEEFAAVSLYTSNAAGIKVVDVNLEMAKPHHFGDLDLLVTINSTVRLLDYRQRVERERELELALEEALGAESIRVGAYIILDIKSEAGETYKLENVDEMTMAAAKHRADARTLAPA